MSCERDEIEKDYTFVGFLIMENRLKPVTTGVIDLLHAADIRTIMVTGDNALTAISVARQCHIVSNHQTVYLGDLSEKKVNGEEVILWKDFEHSENRLTNVLEPDGTMPKKVRSDRTKTFGKYFINIYYSIFQKIYIISVKNYKTLNQNYFDHLALLFNKFLCKNYHF